MTADIDLIIDFSSENISRFEKCMNESGYFPSIPVPFKEMGNEEKRNALAKEKNMPVYSFYNSHAANVVVDVLVYTPVVFDELWNNCEKRKVGNAEVYLASVDGLIKLKEYAGRPQDKSDIILLSKMFGKDKT
ncbi:MAG: hypothetical protein ABIQ40_12220 [Bacteroidia bacterium]